MNGNFYERIRKSKRIKPIGSQKHSDIFVVLFWWFCLIKDSVTLGLNREVINMKKKFWLTLYNIGVSILFLLSLYSYAKGMAGFSLFLALAVFGEIAARAFIECKYLQESPEIKEDTAYRITKVLRLLSEIILIIGVWRIRFK